MLLSYFTLAIGEMKSRNKEILLLSYINTVSQLTTTYKNSRTTVNSEVDSWEAVGGFPENVKNTYRPMFGENMDKWLK